MLNQTRKWSLVTFDQQTPMMIKDGDREMLGSPSSLELNNVRRLRTKSPGLIEVLSQTRNIAEYRIAMENLRGADLAISPDVEEIGFWQFQQYCTSNSNRRTSCEQGSRRE